MSVRKYVATSCEWYYISIVNLLSSWLIRAHVPHIGGAWGNPQTSKGTFSEQINRLSDNDRDNNR